MQRDKTATIQPDAYRLEVTEQLLCWLGVAGVTEWRPTEKVDIGQVRALVSALLLLSPGSRSWWVGVLLYAEDAALGQLLSWVRYCVEHKPAPCSSLNLRDALMQWLFAPYDASNCISSACLAARSRPRGKRARW